MKFLRTPLIIFIISALLTGCQNTGQPADTENAADKQNSESGYDEALAKKLGADDYGMKPYIMAFLKAGPNRSQDKETAAKLQKAHLDNIKRMAEEGSLVLAGPFIDDGEIRGIYIFDVATIEEARALTETDPAIQAGRLMMELHPWYGTAALPVLKDVYPKLAKKSF